MLGPALCHDCKRKVWWIKEIVRIGRHQLPMFAWHNADGTVHKCR